MDELGKLIARKVGQMMPEAVRVRWDYEPMANLGVGGGFVVAKYGVMNISTHWELMPYMLDARFSPEKLAIVAGREIGNMLAHRAGVYFLAGVPK